VTNSKFPPHTNENIYFTGDGRGQSTYTRTIMCATAHAVHVSNVFMFGKTESSNYCSSSSSSPDRCFFTISGFSSDLFLLIPTSAMTFAQRLARAAVSSACVFILHMGAVMDRYGRISPRIGSQERSPSIESRPNWRGNLNLVISFKSKYCQTFTIFICIHCTDCSRIIHYKTVQNILF
jgi:hypothetical protein